MVKKRSGFIPAILLLVAVLVVLAEPAPAETPSGSPTVEVNR